MTTGKNLVRICAVSELPGEGNATEIDAGSLALCVARVDGKISALDNECPHQGGPLGEGTIEDGKVVCPWHEYHFDLATGKCIDPEEQVRVYEVTVTGDDVFVAL